MPAIWATGHPDRLLDHWWLAGECDRVYAIAEARVPIDQGMTLALYISIDRDLDRARRMARRVLVMEGVSLTALLGLPRDPQLAPAIIEIARIDWTEYWGATSSILDADTGGLGASYHDDPGFEAWVAVARRDRSRLEGAMYMGASDLAAQAHAMGAYDLEPKALRHGALAENREVLDHANTTEKRCVVQLAWPRAIPEWADELRRHADDADEQYAEGLLTGEELANLRWVVADGAARARLVEEAQLAARLAACDFARAICAPTVRKVASEKLRANTLDAKPNRVGYRLRTLAEQGYLDLIPEVVDAFEAKGGFVATAGMFAPAVLSYCPGRAAEAAELLDAYAPPDDLAAVAGGLYRDGDRERSAAFARRLFAQRSIGEKALRIVAPAIIDDRSRARVAALFADEIRSFGVEPGTFAVARSIDIEAKLVDDPELYDVYRDYLHEHGDPRAELIAHHRAGHEAEAEAWIARHRDHFYGPLVNYLRPLDESKATTFRWRDGFIASASFGFDHHMASTRTLSCPISLGDAVETLLTHPSGAMLDELVLRLDRQYMKTNFDDAIEALARHGAPALTTLYLGRFHQAGPRPPVEEPKYELSWVRLADLSRLWPKLPRLRQLTIQGNLEKPILGALELDLEKLTIITTRMHVDNVRALAARPWTQLESLELWIGESTATVDDLLPLLDLPRLRVLRIMNSTLVDDLIEPLAMSPMLPRLRELSLALGTMTDVGLARLNARRASFAHLDVLDLEHNCLTDEGWGEQKDPVEERFISVSE